MATNDNACVLQEDDVPGAKCVYSDPSEATVVELRRWLSIKKMGKLSGAHLAQNNRPGVNLVGNRHPLTYSQTCLLESKLMETGYK